MSDYDYGTMKEFKAGVTVPPGETLDGPINVARVHAYQLCDEWGKGAPHKIGLFRFAESWSVKEHGATWVATYAIRVRVVTLEESTTLPGQWSYDANTGFLSE